MTKTIREMCLRYTDLSEHDIDELIHTAPVIKRIGDVSRRGCIH